MAVTLSAVRFLPMVVALLPLLRGPTTRTRDLLLPTHFTAASMWVECFRLLPPLPRERRIAFSNGLGLGFLCAGHVGSVIGYFLAASLPVLLTAALLFLTPMSFLVSTARNSSTLVSQLALGLGLAVGPVLTYFAVGLDLMWSGIIGGHRRLRHQSRARGDAMNGLGALSPYLVLILVGFLPNEIWRMLGIVVARGLDEDSELIIWVRAVAVAILAAVIAKLVVVPPGALAGIPLSVRLGAIGCGFAAFLVIRRSVFAGLVAGEAALIGGALLFGQ